MTQMSAELAARARSPLASDQIDAVLSGVTKWRANLMDCLSMERAMRQDNLSPLRFSRSGEHFAAQARNALRMSGDQSGIPSLLASAPPLGGGGGGGGSGEALGEALEGCVKEAILGRMASFSGTGTGHDIESYNGAGTGHGSGSGGKEDEEKNSEAPPAVEQDATGAEVIHAVLTPTNPGLSPFQGRSTLISAVLPPGLTLTLIRSTTRPLSTRLESPTRAWGAMASPCKALTLTRGGSRSNCKVPTQWWFNTCSIRV